MHRLISLARDEAIDGAAIFSSRTLSSSAPVALLEGMDSIICCVCSGVIGGKFNLQSECLNFLTKAVTVEGSNELKFASGSDLAKSEK